jgi:hypothetical protein
MTAFVPKYVGISFHSSIQRLRQRAKSSAMKKNATVSSSVQASTFHDFSGKTLGGGTRENPTEGVEISYSKFRGKVVLINNVATM